MEAMALGMCIVSTDVGGIPYLLEDGHNASLVPPGDPEAMAAAVRRVLTEPGLGSRLSRNARITAEAWDWDLILPRWEKLLQNVAEGSYGRIRG
jgi:glycosyltransferase involved in cell wall biosynthesis